MGVCCIVIDIDGMLFEFCMNFWKIKILYNILGKKKSAGGGGIIKMGGGGGCKKIIISFYAVSYITK